MLSRRRLAATRRERGPRAPLRVAAKRTILYRPKGDPLRVNVHDFEDKDLGKVVPYGVYDVTANAGFVSVGITTDTAQFAVQSIRTWLARMGRERYPDMKELTITADCGGSNGARVRLWKIELQKLADDTESDAQRAPLSAGNVEVEQDRAPPVLPYHAELARPASDGSYRRRRTHRRDDDKGGPQGRMRARRANL